MAKLRIISSRSSIFVVGAIIGLILGTVVSAGATYITADRWRIMVQATDASLAQALKMGYVAGAADAMEFLSFGERSTLAYDVAKKAAECIASRRPSLEDLAAGVDSTIRLRGSSTNPAFVEFMWAVSQTCGP